MASRAAELRELNDTELEHRLGEAKEELFNLRFQNATGALDNIARLPQVDDLGHHFTVDLNLPIR